MVPEAWKLCTIEEISRVASGGTPSRKDETYWGGSIPWVTTAEVQFGTIYDTSEKITAAGLANSSAKLFPVNTILIAMYGQGKTRGQVAKLGIEATTNQACAAIILNNGYDVDYYFQFLISRYKHIRDLSNSGGQENLSAGIVKSIQIPVPPLSEQKKIAQILSTWDKAITTTEKLLDNSGQQKQALMQQLLTGKKRFQEFHNEWATKYLKQLCNIKKGEQLNKNTLSTDFAYPVINGGISPSGYTDKFNREANRVTISEGGNSCGFVSFMSTKFWCGGHCYSLENANISTSFLFQLLKYHEAKIMRLRVGSGLPNIQKKDIEGLELSISEFKQEQEKIALVLSTSDKQIERLQKKLNFLRQEKKALIQQLLTGKKRVKIDDVYLPQENINAKNHLF